jgi:hypothetical protein
MKEITKQPQFQVDARTSTLLVIVPKLAGITQKVSTIPAAAWMSPTMRVLPVAQC